MAKPSLEHHRMIVIEHKLVVDKDDTLIDCRKTHIIFNEGDESNPIMEISTHKRSIGDRFVEVKEITQDGETKEEHKNSDMSPEEEDEFLDEWDNLWTPSITEKDIEQGKLKAILE